MSVTFTVLQIPHGHPSDEFVSQLHDALGDAQWYGDTNGIVIHYGGEEEMAIGVEEGQYLVIREEIGKPMQIGIIDQMIEPNFN
jgi:hypothetical protein